jgi:hypothetical protein
VCEAEAQKQKRITPSGLFVLLSVFQSRSKSGQCTVTLGRERGAQKTNKMKRSQEERKKRGISKTGKAVQDKGNAKGTLQDS